MTLSERPIRLVLLTQWFDPEPTAKGLAFARRLQALGFDVEVVTGFPNYPGGKVYDGYRIRPIRRERQEGVAITRLALYPSHDRSRIGRVMNYLSFFLSAVLYLVFFMRRADVLYVYHPPLTTGMAAGVVRLVRRMPVVLDVQDLWPDTLRATGMITNGRLLKIIDVFCNWTWRCADHIAVQSEGFQRVLRARGVPEDRITIIRNWADEAGMGTPSPSCLAFGDAGRFRVLFAGNMGAGQALHNVLDAAAIVARTRPEIDFCFLGSGVEAEHLKDRANELGLGNVLFLPRVPPSAVGAYLAAADCLLVHLRADPLFAITIPSKTQACMWAGKPIVMAVEGEAADLIRQSGGGVVVPPEQPQALADAVMRLSTLGKDELVALGANARRFYETRLSFAEGTLTFAKLLRTVAAQGVLATRRSRQAGEGRTVTGG